MVRYYSHNLPRFVLDLFRRSMCISLYRAGLLLLIIMASNGSKTHAQQVDIGRIEQMPNLPSPYEIRDWRQVAIGYDAFVFDLERTGTYLPLIWLNTSTVNYPKLDSFGLETVVGTSRQRHAEGINILPALVGATLAGIDKSDQSGYNWVLMAEEFFNRRPEENVYLNLPATKSGTDWWYETMPNIFFYQLYDLYPNTGDFARQFTTVADRFLEAVETMGGSAAPWAAPNMDYRAWSLSTMRPLRGGVKEPEAAGAIAWLLYNTFTETGDDRYRQGAEWAMEFLDGRTSNPSYEIQLPYGVYAAARMNAELGTSYNVEKMVNWTFDVGPLRNWGALLGTWGGYDIDGLIGEASFNDYAFMMNGFQQAGALVPMTRYDDRFARAIGKWVLNLANASRLFYPNYLPASNQDSEAWAFEYDPDSYIGHEAIRQEKSGQSPYATGDAISGQWGSTNLVLYGSSHVGMLGGILDTTDVEGILQLDLLKTDFFGADAYPTHLYFNPHAEDMAVTVDLGDGTFDLYDAVSNGFVLMGAGGSVQVTIPADAAVMLVRAPAGGAVTRDANRMLIDGVVVDYGAGQQADNFPPRIKALDAIDRSVFRGGSTSVFCTASDRDGDPLAFTWLASGGQISGEGSTVVWTPPDEVGDFDIDCTVADGRGGIAAETIALTVFANHVPKIERLSADPPIVELGGTTVVTCQASDEDGDALSYQWEADAGTFNGQGSEVSWTAPALPGHHVLSCLVDDGAGASAVGTVGITTGDLVGYYPFNGNSLDESGFGNHATVSGAVLVSDRDGVPNAAYAFDGVDDVLTIPRQPSLDFRDAMTVTFWMRPYQLFARESFLISHGSWQNRWKVSIIPEKLLRWTVKTASSVKDVDSGIVLAEDSLYHVAATYDGSTMKLYVDGLLNNEVAFSGRIELTRFDLTMGQMWPGNTEWNYKGEIDDVRIYNRALSDAEVAELVGIVTAVDDPSQITPATSGLKPNYPNPFTATTTIQYELAKSGPVAVSVFDLVGRQVLKLFSGNAGAGIHRLSWDGRDGEGRPVSSGVYFVRFEFEGGVEYREIVRVGNPR